MDTESLDDILNAPAEEDAITVETVEGPTEGLTGDGEPPRLDRGPDGKFISKTGVEDTGSPPDKLPQEEYREVRKEREKRQALERDMEALRAQLQSLQNPPAPPPSLWEDEEGARQHDRQQAVNEAVQVAVSQSRMQMSEMMARQAEPEFDTLKAEFLALAEKNPALAEQAITDPHPWNKAISIARNHKAMTDLGAVDVADLEAKIRAKIMDEMQAIPPARPGLPPTLTTERNVGGRSGPAWSGPASLDELLRH